MKYSRIVTTNNYEWMFKLSTKELALLIFMVEECTTELDTAVAIIDVERKKQFAKHSGITLRSVNMMLQHMIDICYIVQENTDIYMVNPNLVNHGHQSYIERNYERFSKIMYERLSPLIDIEPRYALLDLFTGEISGNIQ